MKNARWHYMIVAVILLITCRQVRYSYKTLPKKTADCGKLPLHFDNTEQDTERAILTRSTRPSQREFWIRVHNTRQDSWLSESLINTGSVEDDILDLIETSLSIQNERGELIHFIDVGANIGFVSLFAAAIHPSIRVTAIEAMPWHYQLLLKSLQLNPELASRVKLFPAGLGPVDGPDSLCMQAQPDNAAATSATLGKCTGDGVSVPVMTLDDVLLRSWSVPPYVMKMDVEGFEPLILDGARRLLKHPPRLIISEFVPFRVKRAMPDRDPYDSLFSFFPEDSYDVRIVRPAEYGLAPDSDTNATIYKLKEFASLEHHPGCNVDIRVRNFQYGH
jgi:FkbM family methyltransferase